ncbi:MAG TPA: hypothetical protein PLC59_03945 [Bacteroidales bacterium]|jgi:hypothetical protein|nr:hypothetical protein [Bacteroidales bacterium]HQI45186.1 hypothetical protein [Bacteroidales bacterium]
MKLRELKKLLTKYPPDMDDMEVIIVTGEKGKKKCDLLCFTGYLPIPKYESIVLGTFSAVKIMVETGEISKPEGYDDFMNNEN